MKILNLAIAMILVCGTASAQTTAKEEIIFLTSQWEGERFADGRPKVSKDILERMKSVSIEEAWVVLRNEGYHNPNEDPLLPVGSDIQTGSEDDGVNASALKRVSVFLSFFLAVCVYIYSLFDYSVDSDPIETTFPLITHLIFLCLSLSLLTSCMPVLKCYRTCSGWVCL